MEVGCTNRSRNSPGIATGGENQHAFPAPAPHDCSHLVGTKNLERLPDRSSQAYPQHILLEAMAVGWILFRCPSEIGRVSGHEAIKVPSGMALSFD